MKIAFVSYEYPPDTAFGGIATYVRQAAMLLAGRGHAVEVFAASPKRSGRFQDGNIGVNLVGEMDRLKFAEVIAPIFSIRHETHGFNVIESPEYNADGRLIRKNHPRLPHVVKLHTPIELLEFSGLARPNWRGWLRHYKVQARMVCGAFRRLQRPLRVQPFCPHRLKLLELHQLEREYAQSCDLLVSPSQALADWTVREWSIPSTRIMVVPNPYVPTKRILDIPVGGAGNIVGYFGRLEHRKGVADLIEAIPLILQAKPDTRFRFVGGIEYHPGTLEKYDVFLKRRLKRFRNSIEILGALPLDQMAEQYAAVDVCVFPSVWENFPNVCLEAMAAGRAIVASNAGGMAEMLEGGLHGILVPPRKPKAIAEGVVHLLRSPDLCRAFGASARQRLLDAYSLEKIGPQLERSFETAIALTHER
jgi:glycosyltransferase involved in cell wall biosynthesis